MIRWWYRQPSTKWLFTLGTMHQATPNPKIHVICMTLHTSSSTTTCFNFTTKGTEEDMARINNEVYY